MSFGRTTNPQICNENSEAPERASEGTSGIGREEKVRLITSFNFTTLQPSLPRSLARGILNRRFLSDTSSVQGLEYLSGGGGDDEAPSSASVHLRSRVGGHILKFSL